MPIQRLVTTMARQTTTAMISTFLVRSLIYDFPKRSMIALVCPYDRFGVPRYFRGRTIKSQQSHLAEHQRLVLLLRANDLRLRAKNLRKTFNRSTEDRPSRQSGPPVRWR